MATCILKIFTKDDNFCDFFFAFLGNEAFPNWGQIRKKQIGSQIRKEQIGSQIRKDQIGAQIRKEQISSFKS